MYDSRSWENRTAGRGLRMGIVGYMALLVLGILLQAGPVRGAERTGDDVELPAQTAGTTTVSLKLAYDDYYSWATDYPGYTIQTISAQNVTSKMVSAGAVQNTEDSAVLEKISARTVHAVGTGTARVTLVNTADAADQILVNVTVSPAQLTVMLLAGQSNMEGVTGYHEISPLDSVACQNGTVYSTYMPTSSVRAQMVTGISGLKSAGVNNVKDVVAGSLTDSRSVSGKTLAYPLNAMTKAGGGKTGPDSGLAWEWNRRTGQKVYVVNAAASASYIDSWAPGGASYERELACFREALSMVNAEVGAGHYVLKNKLMFWLHGEANSNTSALEYRSYFVKMYNGFRSALGIQALGMIVTRSIVGNDTNEDSIAMSGPRVCQYNMAADPNLSGVWMVSVVNEKWITDSGVEQYFRSRYPSGRLPYSLRSGTSLSGLPTTVEDVHPDIHYTQVGHNENGITAADTMLSILSGGESPTRVIWRYGKKGAVSSLELVPGKTAEVAVEVSPLSASKKVKFDAIPSGGAAEMSTASAGVIAHKAGSSTLRALYNGKVLSQLTVKVLDWIPAPVMTSASIADGQGVTVKWKGVEHASGYRVYRRAAGGSWAALANVASTKYIDKDTSSLAGGTQYFYTVRCLDSQGAKYSEYDPVGAAVTWLTAPVLTGISADTSGLTVTWKAVKGAVKYKIYRKTPGGSWTGLGYTTSTSYRDSGISLRTTYIYTVRAVAANGGASWYDEAGVRGVLYESPAVTVDLETDGMTVSWKAVQGCSRYRVYYKAEGSTQWNRAADVNTTAYKVTGLTSGRRYYFTARCMDSAGRQLVSGYVSSGAYLYLKAPDLTSVSGEGSCVTVKWAAQPGADTYILYRRVGSGSWVRLLTGNVLSYQDKAVKTGVSYTYTLRAYSSQYKVTSGHTAGTRVVNCEMPLLKKITASDVMTTGLLLKWDPVPGAEVYRIYRKSPNGSWQKLKDVKGTESQCLCTGLTSGEETAFTIRCVTADSRTCGSGYSATGVRYTWVGPVDFYMMKGTDNIRVMWSAVKGAESYRVYRRTAGSGWTLLGKTSGLYYTDTGVTPDTVYYYTVRAVKGSYVGSFESGGKRVEFRTEELSRDPMTPSEQPETESQTQPETESRTEPETESQTQPQSEEASETPAEAQGAGADGA